MAGRLARWVAVLVLGFGPGVASAQSDGSAIFDQGMAFDTFVAGAQSQKTRWTETASGATVARDLVDRLGRVASGLRLVVVAEDWCIDSANTVPFIARLAADAHVEMRMVNSSTGRALLDGHHTADGRSATPLVVLLRDGQDVGAWIERPAALQTLIATLLASPDAVKLSSERQAWYDRDRGQSALAELVRLAEQTQPSAR